MLHPYSLSCRGAVVAAWLIALFLLPSAVAGEGEWVYRVKPGDTLISIGSEYLANPNRWDRLQSLNHVANPRRLIPGSPLRLPVALLKRQVAVAEAVYVRGGVMRVPAKGAAMTLATGDRLQVGDTVQTGADAMLTLRFVDGSRLLVTPGSRITLAKLITYGKTGMAQTVIDLQGGSVETQVNAQPRPAARYEIKSRALNLAVRGTEFRAHVQTSDGLARSEVLGGAVQAQGAKGKPLSLPAGFGTVASVGGAPSPAQPLPGAPDLSRTATRLDRVPVRFEWQGVPNARAYRAQVFANRAFDRLQRDGVFEGNRAQWADLPDGDYVLRVRAIDASGLEGLNADVNFVLKARPEPPFLSAPLEGQKVYGPQAVFRWTASATAQSYHLQLSDQADFSRLRNDLPGLTGTEQTLALPPGPYYWRIAAVAAGDDQGPFSDVQAFTQRKIPESPTLDAPQIDKQHLVFRWRAGEAGSTYRIQVARDTAFAHLIHDQVVPTNQSQLDRPASGAYFLRVQTLDTDGYAGPFGPAQMVEVPADAQPWWLLLFLIPLAF